MLSKLNKQAIKTFLIKNINTLGDISTTIVSSILLIGIIFFLGAKAPEIHGIFIRKSVGAKVFIMKDSLTRGGGGTGFSVKGRSGISYIITNDHVCKGSKDGRTMLVLDDLGNYIRRNIVSQSDRTDLCLLEGIPGVEGLDLGSPPSIGQIVAAVGHPALKPITLSRGEIVGAEDVEIPEGLIGEEHSDQSIFGIPVLTKEECSKHKNRIRIVSLVFADLALCTVVTKKAYISNVLIQPGSSGSPVVNFWGNVVGVVFAGDRYGWGNFVSFSDLENFLSMY